LLDPLAATQVDAKQALFSTAPCCPESVVQQIKMASHHVQHHLRIQSTVKQSHSVPARSLRRCPITNFVDELAGCTLCVVKVRQDGAEHQPGPEPDEISHLSQ
jgi:hypothetical protein